MVTPQWVHSASWRGGRSRGTGARVFSLRPDPLSSARFAFGGPDEPESVPGGHRHCDPLVLALFAATLLAALSTLGRTIVPALDEGAYLATARLMVHDGRIPFRDFALAHPPLTMLLGGAVLEIVGWRLTVFDALYAAWCLAAVFPVARITRALTGNRSASLLAALLFLTFPEFLRWDARFFALRQFSLPFLAFGLEALWVRRRPALAGFLVGLFGASLVPHALLAVILGAAAARELWREGEPKAAIRFVIALAATLAFTYGATALVPGFWASVFGYQVSRERVSMLARLGLLLRDVIPESGPILVGGLVGSFLLPREGRAVAVLNVIGLPLVLSLPQSFYPHYLSSFGPSLAIAAGCLATVTWGRRRAIGRSIAAGVAAGGLFASGRALKEPLSRSTPHLFRIVEALRHVPEPVLCLEPIYALWAGREMTFHYFVTTARYSPSRYFDARGGETFEDLVSRSRSVLVDPNLSQLLTPDRIALLQRDFVPVFRAPLGVVLVRRSELAASP